MVQVIKNGEVIDTSMVIEIPKEEQVGDVIIYIKDGVVIHTFQKK